MNASHIECKMPVKAAIFYHQVVKYVSFKGELKNVLLILVQQSNKLTLLKTDPVLSASLRPLKVLLFATEN